MQQYSFTAFTNADLFGDMAIAKNATFTLPQSPTVEVTVTDNDSRLSGDFFFNERGDDLVGQHATLTQNGEEVGTGGRLYAENTWRVMGADGHVYKLVELEQPGEQPDTFTFLGPVPPAGLQLTVLNPSNVFFAGLPFSKLGAGEIVTAAPNIVEIATGSDGFNILVKALSAAGLVETVQAADDITVFAPTDAAFTALAVDLGYTGDASDEDAVFGYIAEQLTVLGGGDPIPLLTDILLYHVSPGAQTAAEVDAAEQITTLLAGSTFGSEGSTLVDNEPDVADPNIVVPDIAASNGTVHVIDRVLLPIDIPGNEAPEPTIAGLVAASGDGFDMNGTDFDLLLAAVQTAGLAGALDDPDADLTVFAPNDAAFVGLASALGFKGTDEGEAFGYLAEALTLLGKGDPIPLLTEILTYHIAPERLDSTDVLGAEAIETLQGGTLGVDGTTLTDADPDVADPTLIATDIEASNGIVHVLDGVLLPADILQSDGSNNVDFIIDDDNASFIRTGSDNDFVDGNGGNDRIVLGRGNDVGFGGDGNDHIRGGAGEDTIIGGAGHDYLIGGWGEDVFVFNEGDGRDTIIGFQDDHDQIDLSSMGLGSFEDLEGLITRLGAHRSKIEFEDGSSIMVRGLHLELTEDDFIL